MKENKRFKKGVLALSVISATMNLSGCINGCVYGPPPELSNSTPAYSFPEESVQSEVSLGSSSLASEQESSQTVKEKSNVSENTSETVAESSSEVSQVSEVSENTSDPAFQSSDETEVSSEVSQISESESEVSDDFDASANRNIMVYGPPPVSP